MRKNSSKYRHLAALSQANNPRTPTIVESREEEDDDGNNEYPKGFHQWIRYELAALKIQRLFRKYRSRFINQRNFKLYAMQSLGRYALSHPRYAHSSTYLAMNQQQQQASSMTTSSMSAIAQAMTCFHKIIQQMASFEEKIYFWRVIQDLKHAFPDLSADILLKALLEAQGDYSKAQVLLTDKDYILLQGKTPLPSQVRMMFLPTIGPWEYQYTSILYGDTSGSGKTKGKNSSSPGRSSFASPSSPTRSTMRGSIRASTRSSMRSTLNSAGGTRRSSVNNHVDTIKLLRSQQQLQGKSRDAMDRDGFGGSAGLSKREQLMELFMNVVEKTYFHKPPPPVISSTGTKVTKK